jgi:HEAT repeat protein
MDINDYLQILSRKRSFWVSKEADSAARLEALEKIAEFGRPDAILNLIPFLKDKNPAIRNATCSAISQLQKKINATNQYYSLLRWCGIAPPDIDYYERTFAESCFFSLLTVASLSSNGYTREKAVKKLGESGDTSAIPFIILRLADWVAEVRQAANGAIQQFRKPEFLTSLVENLPIFEVLRRVERLDLKAEYSDLISYIASSNRDFVVSTFKEFSNRPRVLLARHLADTGAVDVDFRTLFLDDPNPLIRQILLDISDPVAKHELEQLLKDRSPMVRLKALRHARSTGYRLSFFEDYLADTSAAIRSFCRYELRGHTPDYTSFYFNKLNAGEQLAGALTGMAEMNGKEHSELVASFLENKTSKVRKAAFNALKKLDAQRAYAHAMDKLDSDRPGEGKQAVGFLSGFHTPDTLEKARVIFKSGDPDSKRLMLRLFSNIGRWAVVGDLMLGTIDEDADIRELSLRHLQNWKMQAARVFTKPSDSELAYAKKAFETAFAAHEENKYFVDNPLDGMDFYLR